MKIWLANIFRSEFLKSVLTLFTGTLISQLISFLLLPVFARLYNDEDFGEFGLYSRIVAVIGVLCTLKYENTIPLPKDDHFAKYIFQFIARLSLIMSIAFIVVGFIIVKLIPELNLTNTFILFAGISTFFLSINLIGVNWSLRKRNFMLISRNKLLISVVGNAFRLIFGIFKFQGIGLILAATISYIVGIFSFRKLFAKYELLQKNDSKGENPIKEYRGFATVGTFHSLVDVIRDLILAFFITQFFGKGQFGQYTFSLTMLGIPLTLVGQAIGQVFYKKMIDLKNSNQKLSPFLMKTIGLLFSFSFIPFFFLFLYAEELFNIAFSKQWHVSGEITQILAIWYFFNFLISPISNLPMVIKKQTAYFFFGLVSTCIQVFCLGVLPILFERDELSFLTILQVMSIALGGFFVICGLVLIYWAKQNDKLLVV